MHWEGHKLPNYGAVCRQALLGERCAAKVTKMQENGGHKPHGTGRSGPGVPCCEARSWQLPLLHAAILNVCKPLPRTPQSVTDGHERVPLNHSRRSCSCFSSSCRYWSSASRRSSTNSTLHAITGTSGGGGAAKG